MTLMVELSLVSNPICTTPIMAVAAVPALLEAAAANAPQILSAAQMGAELASRYGPKVKGAVNHLFRMGRKKKTAISYLKKLRTTKGLHKFVTKDMGKALHMSGQAISRIAEGGRMLGAMAGQKRDAGGMSKAGIHISSALEKAARVGKRYHHMAELYHERGRDLISPLNAYRF
jgi:hypothetical protein